jgi:hypothetical protein
MLPKPLQTSDEVFMETRRKYHMSVFNSYRPQNCNKWGEQKTNLTEEEAEGLKSLRKRIKNEEIVILRTEKTGKFCVMNRDKYKEVVEK